MIIDLSPPTLLTGVLLSGGKSQRMGRDKGMLPFRDGTLASNAHKLLSAFTSRQMIIANSEGYEDLKIPVYPDLILERGPAGGIYTGLTHSDSPFSLILACDMPLVSPGLLKYLVDQIPFASLSEAIVPLYQEQPQPLCALYARRIIPRLRLLINRDTLKMMDILKELDTLLVPIEPGLDFFSPNLFFNVNTPFDLEQIS